ncbi:helix-turn-helix transcriptional regulator [Gordonia sp. OPL2]|uniref:helix-turn-helix domain-containing protein n=1 Tax=Gordonia sp. OPL2 TaxID=2486274 RepID=UPI001656225B|nr:helix-turn-helix transcriptional regulator [Gordonia sp. OPL2]ROZ99288.1 LuxR family transcriptional regulator [Gordonia sp. OPL2]
MTDRSALARIVRDVGVRGAALDCALVVGPPGTGRSAILRSVAELLRDNGVRVIVGVPADDLTPDVDGSRRPIVVADDLHMWPVELLDTLVRRLDDGTAGVVGATENRDRDPAIAGLIARARRSGADLLRRPMSTGAVIDRAAAQGLSLDATTASHIRRRCSGASAVIDDVLAIIASGDVEAGDDGLDVGSDVGDLAGPVRPVRDPISIAESVARDHRHRVFRTLDDDTLSVLALASSRAALDPVSVAATLEITADDAAIALDRARGSGFLGGADVFPAVAAESLCDVIGPERLHDLRRRAVQVRLRSGAPTVDDALRAVGAGIVDPVVVETLCAAARESEPARAATLLEAAEAAGGDAAWLRPARARLALDAGDLPGAARLVDDLIADITTPTDRAADALAVAAAVARATGRHTQAADLFRWLGPDLVAGHRVAAVDALLAVGDRAGATTFGQPGRRAPTASRFAEDAAIAAMLSADVEPAVEELIRAWSSVGDPTRLRELGWTSFALAVQCGDQIAAASLRDLIWADTDDPDCALADAWSALHAGDLDAAAAAIAAESPSTVPAARLRRLAIALGVAGRTGDMAGLATTWRQAVPLIVSVEIGLADVALLGELWLAAARIGDAARVARHVAAVDALLDRLDDRAVWRPLWTWYAVRAGLLAGDLTGARSRAGDLAAMSAQAGATRFVAALSEAAAVSVAVGADVGGAGQPSVSTQRITAAVAGLEAVGLRGDAGRLAADAALRADDTAVATSLLRTARSVGPDRPANVGRTVAGGLNNDVDGPLTEREAEVARELLAGFTYREIGERLYISAKTVEHHVARIRRRLDAGSRSELLAAIRAAGYQ